MTIPFRSSSIRTYNMHDEQFAFHRALRSEEVRIPFRGDVLDLSLLVGPSAGLGR